MGVAPTGKRLTTELESVIELAKQGRAPVRAISLVERACIELHAYLDEIEGARAWLAS
jgi:hypothetical protein